MKMPSTPVKFYDFEEFRLDVENRRLFKYGEKVPLTHKTVDILLLLVRHRGEILNKQQFFENIWAESFVDETNLTQHIYRIRKTLGSGENGSIEIETVPKFGYRFNAKVKEIRSDDEPGPTESSEESAYNQVSIGAGDEFSIATPVNEPPAGLSEMEVRSDKKVAYFAHEAADHVVKRSSSWKWLGLGLGVLLITSVILISITISPYQDGVDDKSDVSVAVLPFRVIGGEKPNEKLQLGIADTLISNIGNLGGIKVTPTDSIIEYGDKKRDRQSKTLYEIGEKLKSDIVITGTIQRQNNIIRVNLQFLHVEEKRQFCTASFDSEYSNEFSLQDVIAKKAAKKLVDEINRHEKSGSIF